VSGLCEKIGEVGFCHGWMAQTEEAVEKEMLLQEKDRMYAEVKAVLARQPGPEVGVCSTPHDSVAHAAAV
jgi:hypothetical protein